MVLNPNVNVTVNQALSFIPTAGTTQIALVGTAQYGPTDEIVTVTNFNSALNIFKEDKSVNTSIIKAADIAFNNGATIMKIVRIADSGELAASLAADGNSGLESGVLTFTAKNTGSYGNGFSIDVDVQGTGRIVFVRNGDSIETFDNNGNANGYTTNQSIADAINNAASGSQWVSVAVKSGSETSNLVDALASYTQLASGDDGADGIAASDYTEAFDNLLANEDWDLLLMPSTAQSVEVETTDSFHNAIIAKMNTRIATHNKGGIFLSGVGLNEGFSDIQARTSASERFSLCAPSIVFQSRRTTGTENLNGSFLACALSGNIAREDVEVSPTRKIISANDFIVSTSTGQRYYDNLEIETLLNSRVCVASRIENAFKWARGVTRVSDTNNIRFEINIVRIIDFITSTVRNSLDDFLGQPNIQRIRSAMSALIDGILQTAVDDEVLVAFNGVTVEEGASPDTIDVTFNIQPTFSTNFINVVISISRS